MTEDSVSLATPACSVCIANYNGAGVIEDCLNSVFAQDCDFPFEVIVHDDASSDGSANIVRDRYPNATLIASNENVGFCVSNNRMVLAAHGKYILLLNNDAALFPDALRTLFTYAESHPDSGILGLPQYDAATGSLIDFGSLSDPFLNPIPNLDPNRKDIAMVVGACFWMPIHLWHKLGGFPDWFGSLAEDMYLCCRARLEGYDVRTIPHSGFYHWLGHSLGGSGNAIAGKPLITSRKRRAPSERNKTFVMILCYPWPLLLVLLPVHLVLLLLEGTLISILRRDAGLWRDIYSPLLPSIWANRRRLRRCRAAIQGARKMSIREFIAVFSCFPYKLKMLMKYGLPEVR